jgi:membrane dipeptidase
MERAFGLSKDEEDHATSLFENSIVIDCHLDSVLTREYIGRMIQAGLTSVNLDGGGTDEINEKIDVIKTNSKYLLGPITSVDEIYKAKKHGKIAIFLGAEDAEKTLEPDDEYLYPKNLRTLHRHGLKIIQPCYNNGNRFATGCSESYDEGLREDGLKLMDELNRLNIIVDCSHVSMNTTLDVCEQANLVVATHSNSRAVCENPRNRTDEEIKAITEKGGIIGMVSFPTFVKWMDSSKGERPRAEDLLDHIEHIDKVVGIQCIGIGLDLVEGTEILGPFPDGGGLTKWPDLYGQPGPNGMYRYARGFDSVEGLINMSKGLVSRGYSDEEIRGVLGENWIRIFRKAW